MGDHGGFRLVFGGYCSFRSIATQTPASRRLPPRVGGRPWSSSTPARALSDPSPSQEAGASIASGQFCSTW